MELRHLRYFVAVAEELHFGRAARRLNMAQPPLSQRIQLLEKEVGVQLLTRTRRRVELTDAGKALLADAREILARVDQAVEGLKRAESGVFGRVSVGFVEDTTYALLPRIVSALRQRSPELRMDFTQAHSGTHLARLRAAELDVALLHGPIEDPDFEVEVVRHEPVILGLPTGHRLAGSNAIRLSELSAEAFIVLPPSRELGRAQRFYDRFITACHQSGFSPNIAYLSAETALRVNLAAAGAGVAILPAWTQHLRLPGVVYRPVELDGDQALHFEIVAVWRRGNDSRVLATFLTSARDAATAVVSKRVISERYRAA